VKIYPAQISMRVISLFLKNLIGGCIFLVLAGSATSSDALPSGVMEAENYADYPLLILSVEGQKEIARITADTNGNYRAVLPPGDYVLDVQGRTRGRTRGHLHAKPQRFTVVSNETVRVDMDIDTDHWRVRSTQSFRPD